MKTVATTHITSHRKLQPLQPPARHFLFSGRGPLRRYQIEAVRERRVWLTQDRLPPMASAA